MKKASLPQSIELLQLFTGLTAKRTGDLLSSGFIHSLVELAQHDRIGNIDVQEFRFFLKIDHLQFTMTVNYDTSFAERLEAARRVIYKKVHHISHSVEFECQKHSSGTKEISIDLFRFLGQRSYSDIAQKLEARRMRPFCIEELVAFNTCFPDFYGNLIALGTVLTDTFKHNTWYAESGHPDYLDDPKRIERSLSVERSDGMSYFNMWYPCVPLS